MSAASHAKNEFYHVECIRVPSAGFLEVLVFDAKPFHGRVRVEKQSKAKTENGQSIGRVHEVKVLDNKEKTVSVSLRLCL